MSCLWVIRSMRTRRRGGFSTVATTSASSDDAFEKRKMSVRFKANLCGRNLITGNGTTGRRFDLDFITLSKTTICQTQVSIVGQGILIMYQITCHQLTIEFRKARESQGCGTCYKRKCSCEAF
ncbi:hypothetical protein M8C21_002704 [Ambrosia artemisiifolia]|uniref:Uncharacterized protein n=1 Tax=Ambrosia artemisiifolia TaxID=4212 RepID=A0AAD5BW62_AMBAR|nr:hypothetical protein M8C21_002704 [Ambrosia artemisiifolia]